jgi:hypothetical protein
MRRIEGRTDPALPEWRLRAHTKPRARVCQNVKPSRRKTFYELRADQGGRRVHRLIELAYPDGTDARLCQLQATLSASEILRRVPRSGELRPLTPQAARKLANSKSPGGR